MKTLKKGFRRLFPEKTGQDFPSGYIPHRFVMERVKGGPVLVVGDYEGRDYPAIKKRVKDTYLLDIVDNGVAEKKWFLKQSVTEPIPFADGYFRTVVVGEVIEHVWEDKAVLQEIHRVLASDGTLLLTIPFLHDFPEYHYHVYSPDSVVRLLAHAGFEIQEMQYRGLVVATPNMAVGLCATLLFPFFGKRALGHVNKCLYYVHTLFSHSRTINSLFRFERGLKHYGALIVAKKSKEKIDPVELQRKTFGI